MTKKETKIEETIHCDCDCPANKKTLAEQFYDASYSKYADYLCKKPYEGDKDHLMQLDFIDKSSYLAIPDAVRHANVEDYSNRLCKSFEKCINNDNLPFYDKRTISQRMLYSSIIPLGKGSCGDGRARYDATVEEDILAIEKVSKSLNRNAKTFLSKKEIKFAFEAAIENTLKESKKPQNVISEESTMKKVRVLSDSCLKVMSGKKF